MVKVRNSLPINLSHPTDITQWLNNLNFSSAAIKQIQQAFELSQKVNEGQDKLLGLNCIQQSLQMAEILIYLQADHESIAAGLLFPATTYAGLSLDLISQKVGTNVTHLIRGVQQMQASNLLQQTDHSNKQLDNIRKMFLAMVKDVRVVVIKLAERLCLMHNIRLLDQKQQQQLAEETLQVYAPLANRLGISQLKWELEDQAFYYLEPATYKTIAKSLKERRLAREKRIENIIHKLSRTLAQSHIHAKITGRAKHIYSIYRKMQRKNVSYEKIYDAHAVRILTDTIDHCYAALGIVHELWQPIPEEFDDYIANPKENGYQSIHTAVIDEDGKFFEVQIRTFQMHELSEMGGASHWKYKEGSKSSSNYEEKIIWLRQLLDWQKSLTQDKQLIAELEKKIFADSVYVFTPTGQIIDLPAGSTPLDFAYHIHSDIGHRCKGAKVNSRIVTLTYQLKTGDQVEILTSTQGTPSRDWLLPQHGYLKTSRARAKVLHWFKQQEYDSYVAQGKNIIEKELQRLAITGINFDTIANKLHFKSSEMLFAALGKGEIRLHQFLHALPIDLLPFSQDQLTEEIILSPSQERSKQQGDVSIAGVNNLLTQIAQCCRPVPGDNIIGYITQGRGIAIHREDCKNLEHSKSLHPERLLPVQWLNRTSRNYPVDIQILASDQASLARDISNIFANEKIHITHLTLNTDKNQQQTHINLTIEVSDLIALNKIFDRLLQLPHVYRVTRKEKKAT